jgi:hypothetical protein|tara:strand:+ start:287 stop:547 length:261 start_codon:yes stop_codon:yes gene_type:complete
MNSFKTELYQVTFNEEHETIPCAGANQYLDNLEHVTITRLKNDEYVDIFNLPDLCTNVEEMLTNGLLDVQEALRIIQKSARFFLVG